MPPKDGEKKTKEVGKFTFNWCKHHMAWTDHTPSDCTLGQKHKEDQMKGKENKANSAVVASSATTFNNHYTALLGHSHDHEQRRMMVRTSVHLEFSVSMHGWAIGHRSTNFDLPHPQLPTNDHHLHSHLPRLPYQNLGNSDLKVGSLLPPGETSHNLLHKNQMIQDSCEKLSSQKQNKWSNHDNLPLSSTL